MANYLAKRDGYWIYRRRIPKEFSGLDSRTFVKTATKIRVADDPRGAVAGPIVERINTETEAYWRGMVDGRAVEAKRRYDAARMRARALGYGYAPAREIANQTSVNDILNRIETLMAGKMVASETDVAAVLGGEELPQIMLSGLFDEFEGLEKTSLDGMSIDQIRKWQNPKKRAIANLITVIGDKPIAEITRTDALDFRAWWQDRIVDEDMQIETANKDFGHANKMLRTLDIRLRLGLPQVFERLRFEGGTVGQRQAYDVAFLQDHMLKTGELEGLNDEARAVVYLMAETGMRVSEACNAIFVLDHAVPHVQIRAAGRRTKTSESVRDIPLVGCALIAAQAYPDGFQRYRHRADSLSALVNKFFDNNGLRPTVGHTLYSLRHTFEDRLTVVETPEKIHAVLMGHKYYRPRYGAGPSLEQKREWLHRIVLIPPTRI